MTYFGPALDSSSGSGEEVENVKVYGWTDDDGRTDDGRCAMTMAHFESIKICKRKMFAMTST